MATLVLTAVGALVGGPIGAAVGAVLGSQADRALLAPKGRQGPRLGDLSVQTSSYGSALPRIFGTMRAAGTVIWATDLREDSHSSGSSKSGGKTTTYSYSCSFAVALSARAIRSVGRIWADGNLLRGAAGDWKSDLAAFRLYLGDEGQAVDPLIASAEGASSTPAHRGLAYAMFEGLQLADFGNRIPSLTFEITADAGDVAVAAIAAELSDGAIAGSGGAAIGGYAAGGDSVRGALETLAAAVPLPLSDDGTTLRIGEPATATLASALFGAGAGRDRPPALARERAAAGGLPDAVAVAYYEPARDYQAGIQTARADGIGARATRIDLPAAVTADLARAFAEAALDRAWIERDRLEVHLPWRALDARVGTRAVTPDGTTWRIRDWSLEKMALTLTLVREAAPIGAAMGVDAGRATGGADVAQGATVLVPLDLPDLGDQAAAAPEIWLAAAGTAPGWRRAAVSVSLDDGASWQAAGQTAPPAVIGSAITALGNGAAALFDRANTVEIALLHDGMSLRGADDDAIVAGANVALLGEEIVQFGDAVQIDATRWRLGRLLRGRRGSEWATAGHVAGERFVLLDAGTLLSLPVPLAGLGATLLVSAIGPGDEGREARASLPIVGRAVRPPAPVGLTAVRLPDGTVRFGWTRRGRTGWLWLDGGDVPLGEDGERYRLDITPSTGAPRSVDVLQAGYDYDPAAQAADGAGSATGFAIAVAMLGARASSLPPATGQWTL